ncbi:MAG TPA: undecaprenyl-diphosphate phosphatase [Steroidobacteraceae bacterium]|nr:undecaprenyl-diphosphate phosphatase [Steroidobacteraceae bacterium]
MSLLKIILLAIVQGLAELLPVSSSAHVVVAEKLLGLDPSSPAMTLLLVMLHTGTMFAVIVYFWPQWRSAYFQDGAAFKRFAVLVITATALTAVVGEVLIKVIEKTLFRDVPHAEIEDLFSHLEFIAPALAAAGLLILIAGVFERRNAAAMTAQTNPAQPKDPDMKQAGLIGAVQGLCLPFRGFSRSGATISTAMLLGVAKSRAEAFSFALAVVLTPPIVAREALRLVHSRAAGGATDLTSVAMQSVFGAVVAFFAGLLALKWLSRWLEGGRWYLFGIYCLAAAAAVMVLHHAGY